MGSLCVLLFLYVCCIYLGLFEILDLTALLNGRLQKPHTNRSKVDLYLFVFSTNNGRKNYDLPISIVKAGAKLGF